VAQTLTIEELSRRTGETPKRLLKWKDAGLIGCPDEDCFRGIDVGRARLIHDMLHYGHSLEAIAAAARHSDSVFRRILDDVGERLSRPTYSVAEAAESAGVDVETARRLIDAAGIGEPGDMVTEDDLYFLRNCRIALEAGYPEEALAQILRVYADVMYRAAEVGARTSHFYIHQPIAEQGIPPAELMNKLEATFSRIQPLIEPALIYFFRKGHQRAEWEDLLMHLEEEAGLAEKAETPGQLRRAVMFVDLANFTPLAEAMGDVRAAQVLQRFASMVRAANVRCHGRIVKQIGDAFMIVFPECYSAVSCALEIEHRAAGEQQFPAVRAGLHWGAVLYREGDYIGSTVNIASRLAEDADRHQVLLTEDVWRRAHDLPGAQYIRLGPRHLKGLTAEVEVFEARNAARTESRRAVDPVCGMELSAEEAAARLTLDGHDHAFCSDDCLRKFVAAPDKYTAAPIPGS
jgi:class 3 adenylate cyclase/YHS domain-containing protein